MSQEFWIPIGGGNPNAGDMAYDNTSRVEAKRSHQWFMDGPDTDLLPNKKQALELPSSNSFLELLNSNPSQWGVTSSFQTAPGHFDEQLFDSESARMMNYDERGIPTIGSEKMNLGRKVDENLLANDSPFALSMSHISEDPGIGMNYGAARKVEGGQVKGSEHIIPASVGYGYNKMESNPLFLPHPFVKNDENPLSLSLPSGLGVGDGSIMSLGNTHATENSGLSMGRPHGIKDESASMGQTYAEDGDSVSVGHLMAKEHNNIMSMGQGYQSDVCSLNHMYNKEGSSNPVSVGNSYDKSNIMSCGFGKGQSTIISFGGCNDDNNSSGRLIYNYEMLMGQSSLQMPDAIGNMGLIRSDSDAQVILSGVGGNSKKKEDQNMNKKSPSNNFPSNVRSLLSTGILDGVQVKYIAWSREKELRGIIRGCGYLCGCLSCNYTKVINAYEFERHAGCKTKHPNNHIYFENGKTIYGTVQELRSTPQHMLFEVMQTITGSPINQKSFHLWKESYLAATQELQRIYGKDDGKLLQ